MGRSNVLEHGLVLYGLPGVTHHRENWLGSWDDFARRVRRDRRACVVHSMPGRLPRVRTPLPSVALQSKVVLVNSRKHSSDIPHLASTSKPADVGLRSVRAPSAAGLSVGTGLLLGLVAVLDVGCSDGTSPGGVASTQTTPSGQQTTSMTSGSSSGPNQTPSTGPAGSSSQTATGGETGQTVNHPASSSTNTPTNDSSQSGARSEDDDAASSSEGAASAGFETTAPTSGSAATSAESNGGEQTANVDDNALIVAPNGSADAPGTVAEPTTLAKAVGEVTAGRTIYLRGGTYALNATIALTKDGADGSPIELRGYPGDETRPRLDFSAMPENSSNRGLTLSGDHWYIYGIDLVKAGDNCMFVSGSNNTIEYTTFSECADTGLQLGGGASNNSILNCDSFFNADSSLENADGFAAKLDVGSGNKFVGCRAWNNLDDGWDGYLRPADGVTTIYEDCWAMDNGKLKDGSVGAGDGNGFKTGGSDDKDLRHHAIYRRCIAAGNVNDGFDHNSNRGDVTLLNCAAHDNGNNINFSSSNIAASLTIENTISLGELGALEATVTNIRNNSWQNGLSATEADFVSVDRSLLKAPRKPDGSLPDIAYLELVTGSDLRNAGTDVGLPFAGSAPDLGAFEAAD